MIRSDLLKAILNALGSHRYLALEDFKVDEYKNKQGEPCLSISYRHNTNCKFSFHIPHTKSKSKDDIYEYYKFNCTMSPGQESSEETRNAQERKGLITEIDEWLKRLYEDIVAAPIIRQFENQSSIIEQMQERLDKLPDEPISREDISKFHEGLESIKSEISEQLKHAVDDKDELKQKVDELSADISFLKETLNSMSKKQWGDILIVRICKWKERFSLRQLAAGTRVLQKLLPSNVSGGLDVFAEMTDVLAEVADKTKETK